jgi:muramoyltetrapeptide carboxypeptidase
MTTRRELALGIAAVLTSAGSLAADSSKRLAPKRHRRLRAGDTVGLIEPASATYEAFDIQYIEEVLAAMGLKAKRGAHLLGRNGYLAGADKDRAADVNAMFADASVNAILCVRGGWGCARILPLLDYEMIQANPKPLMGYSDITALHMALQAKTGMMSFHGPNGASAWGMQSVDYFKRLLFNGEKITYRNPVAQEDRLVQKKWRTQIISKGVAQGKLMGGNLTVLSALVGTPYLPDFEGAVLFLEDIGEAEYRIDRMLTQISLAGILKKVRGIVFGQCTECKDTDRNIGGFTLSDIFKHHFGALGVPVFQGGFFGHITDQFTLPIGCQVEINADAGTLTMLEPAVA